MSLAATDAGARPTLRCGGAPVDDDTEIRFESIEDQDVFRVTRAAEDASEAKAFFARIADVATRLPAETALTLWQGVN
jgi:hypothetical protein